VVPAGRILATNTSSISITKIAARSDPGSKELRQQALQTVVEKSKREATRKKAEDALRALR
jgi:3-hydroxyacyl-CoA dehydrogenase